MLVLGAPVVSCFFKNSIAFKLCLSVRLVLGRKVLRHSGTVIRVAINPTVNTVTTRMCKANKLPFSTLAEGLRL